MLRNVRDLLRVRKRRDAPDKAAGTAAPQQPPQQQPRVFRNRSLDYHARPRRWFLRPRRPPSPHLDRPAPHTPPSAASDRRNDDSFSSLPSTHASKDPFLNDDVPVEISRLDPRADRPRPLADPRHDVPSPPASTSSANSRKRSALWKNAIDPDAVQSPHESHILAAVSLSEAVVKERSVPAARQLVDVVQAQIRAMSTVLADVSRRVEDAKALADALPSSRDPAYSQLVYVDCDARSSEAERVFLELHWTERVWDLEAMLAEKRYADAVTAIEKLQADGVAAGSPRTYGKFHALLLQTVSEMSSSCASASSDAAVVFAPLLARLGMADHARQVVLDAARAELVTELRTLSANTQELAPRLVNVILDKTLAVFRRAHGVHSQISTDESNSSSFVAWIVEQCDRVYADFVSPVLSRMRKADPVTILATIEAARHRRVFTEDPLRQDEKSLVALLETRITTHVRNELDEPIRDAERQLIERARMYASAIPRNWKDGPYQSGKAVCDDLNVLSRRLEGALMNLGTEADLLTGNLLVGPALVYCTTLLEMGTKTYSEDDKLTFPEVQEGVFETFAIIGKTLLRLHQKFAKIPMLERVSSALMSPNLGEVRILLAEVSARRTSSPADAIGQRLKPRNSVEDAETGNEAAAGTGCTVPSTVVRDAGLGLLTGSEFGQVREPVTSFEEQARRVLAQQRARIH